MVKEQVTKDLAQFYIVEMNNFIEDKITEQQYVDRHGTNDKKVAWPEAEWLNRNDIQTFSKLLQKLNAINRRNALHQSTRYTQDELRYLLDCGKSVVTAMIKSMNRRISSEYLALFAIIHRVPFSWVNCDDITFHHWDLHNFDHLEDLIIYKGDSHKNEVGKLLEKVQFTKNWIIQPYIANISNNRLYLRVENKGNLVILDLLNTDSKKEYALLSVLKQSDYKWICFKYPSVVIGHYFHIFIGYNDENILNSFISNQFPIINNEFYKIHFNNN